MRAIVVENLWYKYESSDWILQDINFEISKGSSIGLIGPTGSGKTTLAKIIKGLIPPTEGNIYLFGRDIKEYSFKELAKVVGYLFQNPTHQIFSLTVFDEIAFGLRNIGLDNIEERVRKVVKKFGLEDKLSSPPFNMSTGEKERIAIASIIAMDPEILILDEPTLGQDYQNYKVIKDVLHEYKSRGKTVILISHEIDLIESCVEHIIALKDGRIVFNDKKRKFFENNKILEELGFVNNINVLLR